uniref:Reverse transcriptase domain-containing protein n=1 Tax=Timema cristinae TaxID=61476 RepID=A0A7R9CKF6_TIMCR|nr:unnamed protein product [Timema cristinae]
MSDHSEDLADATPGVVVAQTPMGVTVSLTIVSSTASTIQPKVYTIGSLMDTLGGTIGFVGGFKLICSIDPLLPTGVGLQGTLSGSVAEMRSLRLSRLTLVTSLTLAIVTGLERGESLLLSRGLMGRSEPPRPTKVTIPPSCKDAQGSFEFQQPRLPKKTKKRKKVGSALLSPSSPVQQGEKGHIMTTSSIVFTGEGVQIAASDGSLPPDDLSRPPLLKTTPPTRPTPPQGYSQGQSTSYAPMAGSASQVEQRAARIIPPPEFKLTSSDQQVTVYPGNSYERDTLLGFLWEREIQHYTYPTEEEWDGRMVLRGLPLETPVEDIAEALSRRGYQVWWVTQLYVKEPNGGPKHMFPLFLVMLVSRYEVAQLSKETSLNHFKITMEFYHRWSIPQCHNCQRFGHCSPTCGSLPRCVRCEPTHPMRVFILVEPNSSRAENEPLRPPPTTHGAICSLTHWSSRPSAAPSLRPGFVSDVKGTLLRWFSVDSGLFVYYPNIPTYIPSQAWRHPSMLDIFLTTACPLLSSSETALSLSSNHNPVFISLCFALISSDSEPRFNFSRANWTRSHSIPSSSLLCNCSVPTQLVLEERVQTFTSAILSAASSSITVQRPPSLGPRLPTPILELLAQRAWRSFPHGTVPFGGTSVACGNEESPCRCFELEEHRSSLTLRAEALADCFKAWFRSHYIVPSSEGHSSLPSSPSLSPIPTDPQIDVFLVIPVEIREILFHLHPSSRPGLYRVCNPLLTQLPKKAIVFLLRIINAIILLSSYPSSWKAALVVLIPKSGKSPPSLLPAIQSAFPPVAEWVILKRLLYWVEDNCLLPDHHFGLRARHSSTHALAWVVDQITDGFSKRVHTGLVVLDVQGAFDSVSHPGLLLKLLAVRLPIHLQYLFQSFLLGLTFQVCLNAVLSSSRPILAGVQESLLFPLLYSWFVHDIPLPPGCSLPLYSNDTALMAQSINVRVLLGKVSCALRSLALYFASWELLLNLAKIQAIIFTHHHPGHFLPLASDVVFDCCAHAHIGGEWGGRRDCQVEREHCCSRSAGSGVMIKFALAMECNGRPVIALSHFIRGTQGPLAIWQADTLASLPLTLDLRQKPEPPEVSNQLPSTSTSVTNATGTRIVKRKCHYSNLKIGFRESAKQVSRAFKDRPMSPMDTAIYWTEYVLRHRGAPLLHFAGADLSLHQYLLLDVVAVLAVFAVIRPSINIVCVCSIPTQAVDQSLSPDNTPQTLMTKSLKAESGQCVGGGAWIVRVAVSGDCGRRWLASQHPCDLEHSTRFIFILGYISTIVSSRSEEDPVSDPVV